jgi:hypothetical protein
MIVSNVIGGLGNQMFQYAMGRALSLRLNCPLHLSTDMFDGYGLHNGYELERVFGIRCPEVDLGTLAGIIGWRANRTVRYALGRPRLHRLWGSGALIERSFLHDADLVARVSAPVYVHGYWQSEKYFLAFQETVRSDFRFLGEWSEKDLEVLELMRAAPSISVHVRRGDYLSGKNSSFFSNIPVAYYEKAMKTAEERIPSARFFVFSDDPEWAATYIRSESAEVIHVSHNQGVRSSNDMRLMASADHQIIANSTFSWWGAWLNPNPEKMVFVPARWFGGNGPSDRDLIPGRWFRIDGYA